MVVAEIVRSKCPEAQIGGEEFGPRFGVAGTNTIERFYDTFGRDAGYALNGIRQSTLAYDAATGRLASMQIPSIEESNHLSPTPTLNSNFFTWSYLDGSDLKSSLAYPNGLIASWAYGNRGELLQVRNARTVSSSPSITSNNLEVVSQYAYTYDAAGRRVACAKSGSAFTTSDTNTYLYNARSELTNATAAVDAMYRYGYAFDDIGNRKTSAERGTNSVYTANQLNQYTAVDDFAPVCDADGNQTVVKTATGIWNIVYNGENRPVRWTQGDAVITMSFGRMGRRVTKNNQRYIYNGYLQICNFHSTATTSNYNYFIWDPAESVAMRPLVWNRNGDLSYYVFDGNKNVSEVVASNNGVAAHYEYAPFGALTAQRGVSAATNTWRFSSEYAEDDTATVYYNYRHYEPVMGRWLSRDPIEENGGLNLIEYSYNNPSLFDSLGNCPSDSEGTSCSELPCLKMCSKIFYPIRRFMCESNCNGLKEKFDKWFEDNKDLGWIDDLPDCPCSIGSGKKSGDSIDDDRWHGLTDSFHGYHEGAALCMRSKSVKGHANQCCYDKCGKLITHGSGSGSVDYAPGEVRTFFKHKASDMDPADWAKELDGGVWGACSEAYLLRRPEKGAEKCPKNP